jgi:hypothetical protein
MQTKKFNKLLKKKGKPGDILNAYKAKENPLLGAIKKVKKNHALEK